MRRTAIAAVVGVAALVAAASVLAAHPRRARFYDAIAGKQNPANGTGQSFFTLTISRSGARVTVGSGEWDMPCTGGPAKGTDLAPTTADRSVRLSRRGSFKISLRQIDETTGNPVADSPVVVSGKFVTGGSATGTLSFKGTASDDHGCNAHVSWKATLRPLNDHFVGTTSGGAKVTFDRTVQRHSVIWNFSVGGVSATCTPSGTSTLDVVDAFVGKVVNRKFSATTEDANAEAVTIKGTFSTSKQASGTVSETDRGGCVFSDVHWTAQFTGRSAASSP